MHREHKRENPTHTRTEVHYYLCIMLQLIDIYICIIYFHLCYGQL